MADEDNVLEMPKTTQAIFTEALRLYAKSIENNRPTQHEKEITLWDIIVQTRVGLGAYVDDAIEYANKVVDARKERFNK